jgi:uncharacterized protein (DUF58 family)
MHNQLIDKYLDPQVLARLTGLRLHARSVVEGYVAGSHRSPYHGFSIEFSQHREYSPGDDLRYLDWKVHARTDKYYLKQYADETNLICHLLLDASESMTYQSEGAAMSKLEYAARAAAALAYLVLRQQDSVGLVAFDEQIRDVVRPGGRMSHIKQLVDVLDRPAGKRKTNTGPILHELAERFKKRGIVILLSDLFDDLGAVMSGLRHFQHRRHKVVLMHVLDPAELDFPFQRVAMFNGLERLPRMLVEPKSLRKAYLEEFVAFIERVKRGCLRHRIDYVQMRTDRPLESILASYLANR